MSPRRATGALLDRMEAGTLPRPQTGSFSIPGQPYTLEWRRSDEGRLIELRCGERTHLSEHEGVRHFGDGLAEVSELLDGPRLMRVVHTRHGSWAETYRSDAHGRVSHVDGVDVLRDDQGRIVRAGEWTYTYAGESVVAIDGPHGHRRIERDASGRAVGLHEQRGSRSYAYERSGLRSDAARLPGTFHRDDLGRLWTVTDALGHVVATYLWEGTSCLARVDGDAREAMAALFSLDPTGTPVRVITAAGNRRVPRDAFGEALLAERGVPGLFGAAVHEGLHYLPARALDPRTGSFCSPDPWNAGPGDPRRTDGRDIPLAVEHPGEYVICRNDPIGRTDPTGCTSGFAALVAFSSLTWASPTTIFGILGFDLGVNFWLSLFSGQIGDYFASFGDGMAARRHGGFGVRRGGLLGLPRAYTIGHYVMHDAASYRSYDLISCFVPSAAMPLVGYGTLLQLVASDGSTFLLDGSKGIPNLPAAHGWTRGGGVGTPVYPGSTVARYDAGGLHIDRNVSTANSPNLNTSGFAMASKTVFGPQACTLTELAPSGKWAAGFSLTQLIAVALEGTGLGISIGNLVALTHTTKDSSGSTVIDSATIAEVANVVEADGKTELTLASSGTGVLTPLRLRTLGAPGAPENASAVAGQPTYLSTAGTTAAYAAGDPLRLSQTSGTTGRAPVGAAIVLRLEAQLAIDAALPQNTALSFTLVVPGAGGGPASVTSTTTINCSGAVPAVPSLIAVTTASGTVPVAATAIADNAAGGKDVTLDRAIALTGSGTWAPLVANATAFGSAQKADTAATLTYQPSAPRTAPPAGSFVRIDASNAAPTARAVTGVNYDALVLSALPGNTGAPYSVERFPFLAVDQDELSFTAKTGFAIDATLTPTSNQTLPGVALRLHELAGPTLAAAAAGVSPVLSGLTLTVSGASLTTPVTAVPSASNPAPGQLMLLSDGGATLELAVVTGLALTVNCDRAWNGKASGLEAIPLADSGPTYPAARISGRPLDVTLASALPSGSNTIATEMPRIGVGEIVKLSWVEGTKKFTDFFRVTAVEALVSGAGTALVDSTTVSLGDGSLVPAGTATGFTVTRQAPKAPTPNTGSTREALNGELVASTTGGNPQMRFSVWNVGSLSSGVFAISDGTAARPMTFVAPSSTAPGALAVQLGAAPARFADGSTPTLRVPKLATPPAAPLTPPAFASTVYAARFTQTGNTVNFTVHPDEPNVLAPATGNIIVAVSFDTTATKGTPPMIATAAAGTVQPGTVLIPEDTSYELTVKEGLVEHETRHTMQYSWLGPLMWGLFPILPFVDKVYPGLDNAEYSPYFDAVLSTEGGASTLRCSNLGSTTLKKGDRVASALNAVVALGERNAKVKDPAGTLSFLISDADLQSMKRVADANGKLAVRKRTNTTGRDVGDVFARDVSVFLTPGGLTEFALSSTWGWFIYGFARLFYAMSHATDSTSGITYDGTVTADGSAILVDDAAARAALEDASRIMVKAGDATVVRTATVGEGDTPLVLKLSLTEPLADLKGKKVQVAPWDTHQPASAWDWHTYYPATVPDPKKPATVKLLPADAAGKNTLTLALQDTVLIRTGTESKRTEVTAVNADGSVDLAEPPQLALAKDKTLDKEFRVAKVGEHDPLGSLGGLFANLQGAPWLGKLVDPWTWLFSSPNLKPGSGGEWAMRVLRWIGSSHAWSMSFPGVLWIDDLFRGSDSYLAWMEQDASENSGDLYSSIGRLQEAPAVVGDIGRYWFFPNGRFRSSYPSGGFDTAGSQMRRETVVAPFVTAETASSTLTINMSAGAPTPPPSTPPAGSTVLPTGAGDALPDALYAKGGSDPRAPVVTAPSAFAPTDRGLVPVSGALERTLGAYVAYSRPGTHRATIIEGFSAGSTTEVQNSRNVVDKGAAFGLKDVTLFFNETIADLAVTMGGVTVNNDDVVPLVLTQAATLRVAPSDASRRYALTLERPTSGVLLRADLAGNDPMTLQVQAPAPLPSTTTERVELCRVYRYDAATDAYDEPSLNTFRMNLPGDLRVPVRRFTVQVSSTLPARAKLSLLPADDVTSVTIGTDIFVLVPTSVSVPLSIAIAYPPGVATPITDPTLVIDTVPVPDDLTKAGFVGTAFKVSGNRNDPPEALATVAFSVGVGAAGLSATLTGSVVLNPAFFLEGAAGLSVARGAKLTLTAKDLGGSTVNVSAVDAGADVTVAITGASIELTVAATATPGTRRVLATSQADASGATKAARTITIT